MPKFAISCDWLQIYALYFEADLLAYIPMESLGYTITLQPYSTQQFRKIYTVYDSQNRHYADIQLCPVSSIISKNGCIIKLSNRVLYSPNFADEFTRFLSSYDFRYQNISRLDVCYDCNVFHNGMKPSRLLRSFLSKNILKNGQTRYTLAGSTDGNPLVSLSEEITTITASSAYIDADQSTKEHLIKCHLNGKFKSDKFGNFSIHGTSQTVRDFSYIMFGSRSSPVCAYMYDKTRELAEVKDKPYIRQLWALNGLDQSLPVWRVEISIKSSRTKLVSLSTGEVARLSPDDLKFQSDISDIFHTYAEKYFHFKENDLKANKTRMRSLSLFPALGAVTKRPITLTNKTDTIKSDKIFLKKLSLLSVDIPYLSDEGKAAIEVVKRDFTISKGLAKYLAYKVCPCVSEARQKVGIKELPPSYYTYVRSQKE